MGAGKDVRRRYLVWGLAQRAEEALEGTGIGSDSAPGAAARRSRNCRDNFDLDAEIRVGEPGAENEGAHGQRIVWDEFGIGHTIRRNIFAMGHEHISTG